jgi:hypothetical protein
MKRFTGFISILLILAMVLMPVLVGANSERMNGVDQTGASVLRGAGHTESGQLEDSAVVGIYHVTCYDKDGNVKWQDTAKNVVTTVGKNLMLDTALAGSSYTVTGPYMGLISSVSWSATAAGDTMASHAGWTEAGSTNAPTFSARIAPSWSAASGGSKTTSATVNFTMTGAGTLEGCFLVYGSGAVTTLMNTAGTLFSAGAFSGGAKVVGSGDTVQVTYTISV